MEVWVGANVLTTFSVIFQDRLGHIQRFYWSGRLVGSTSTRPGYFVYATAALKATWWATSLDTLWKFDEETK